MDYTREDRGGNDRGHSASVFTTVVARFGNMCDTRYGLSERRCAERYRSNGAPASVPTNGAPLDMKASDVSVTISCLNKIPTLSLFRTTVVFVAKKNISERPENMLA